GPQGPSGITVPPVPVIRPPSIVRAASPVLPGRLRRRWEIFLRPIGGRPPLREGVHPAPGLRGYHRARGGWGRAPRPPHLPPNPAAGERARSRPTPSQDARLGGAGPPAAPPGPKSRPPRQKPQADGHTHGIDRPVAKIRLFDRDASVLESLVQPCAAEDRRP